MGKRKRINWTYDLVKEFVEERGYRLLSEEYHHITDVITLECPEGHIFDIQFVRFKTTQKCKICNGTIFNYDFVKSEFDKYGYDLLTEEYQNSHQLLLVKHRECGHTYKVQFCNFRHGTRCPKCANNIKLTFDEIKKYIESFNYRLLSNEYNNNRTRLKLMCPNNHEYETTYDNFKSGCRCPKCKTSKGENKIGEYLQNNNINYISQYSFKDCRVIKPLPFDFYLPDYNVCIEYDGEQHYKIIECFGGLDRFISTKIRDTVKTFYCEQNNIKLIRIPYWEKDNIEQILNKQLINKDKSTPR